MKLRHTAVLALVGWYLFMPPPGKSGINGEKTAPLSEWGTESIWYSDSLADCEGFKAGVVESLRDPRAKLAHRKQAISRGEAAQCIATEDPRLGPEVRARLRALPPP
jgi:hypothetical protein